MLLSRHSNTQWPDCDTCTTKVVNNVASGWRLARNVLEGRRDDVTDAGTAPCLPIQESEGLVLQLPAKLTKPISSKQHGSDNTGAMA